MKIDLNSMNKSELEDLDRAIDERLKALEEERRQAALEEMQAVAEKHGIAMKDLVAGQGRSKKGNAPLPKFRHPENSGLTWSGRGRRPAWVKEALEQGRSLDEMRAA